MAPYAISNSHANPLIGFRQIGYLPTALAIDRHVIVDLRNLKGFRPYWRIIFTGYDPLERSYSQAFFSLFFFGDWIICLILLMCVLITFEVSLLRE